MSSPNSQPLKSDWQTQKLASAYLDGVRGAIPAAQLQLEIILKIVQLWCPKPRYILDLGCGNGILGRFLLEHFPSSQGLFGDFSEPMLAAVRQNLGDHPRAKVYALDFSERQWRSFLPDNIPLDVVISGFAIHHQPDRRKQDLYQEIYDALAPGGLFLNLEHVASLHRSGEDLFDALFVDYLHDFHRHKTPEISREEVMQRYYQRADKIENILAPVTDQCDWLRTIGFQEVDCFFKLFELSLFGGRKPQA